MTMCRSSGERYGFAVRAHFDLSDGPTGRGNALSEGWRTRRQPARREQESNNDQTDRNLHLDHFHSAQN